MTEQPRPNLSSDEAYLSRVQGMIKGKGELEELRFDLLTDAFAALGISQDPFAGVTMTSVPNETRTTINEAFERAQDEELSADTTEKLYALWDYLAEADPLEKVDLIYVFGGISELAVREAIRLKNEDYASKILFSGKHGSYMKDVPDLSEAEKYAQLAIDNGVDPKDILMEKESINTLENVVNSCALLHEIGDLPKRMIAVSLPYHMKRASLTLRAGMDFDFRLIRHPGKSAKYTRETFYTDKNGWTYICNEYIKLRMAREGGHF